MFPNGEKQVSNNARSDVLRTDLQVVVELSEHDSDCLSAEGMYIVGDASLVRLMRCRGLSKQRAQENIHSSRSTTTVCQPWLNGIRCVEQ